MSDKKRIAIVYDWLDKWGGVERVLLTLKEIYPEAIFFTSYYDYKKASWVKDIKINTSFIQKFPSLIKNNRIFSIPFYPLAFESYNFNNFDLVISVSSSFAKSVITQPNTNHICYLLTPTRFLWSHENVYIKNRDNFIIKYLIKKLKKWDLVVSQRPDKIISISNTVKDRCLRYYKRDSEVIYPPFDLNYWEGIKKDLSKVDKQSKKEVEYFLVVSRLEKYKRIELVIKTFNELGRKLIVVGEGSQENYLKRIAKKNIEFYKKLTDFQLAKFYLNSQALIMPQEEDFGYVSLEAQFFGCPIISFIKGGAKETIIDKKTGIFFKEQTVASLKQTIERFDKIKYNLRLETMKFSKTNLKKFSKELFINSFKKLV